MAAIFVPSERYPHFNACLNYFRGLDSMEAACDGYRESVDVLLAEVLERNGVVDTLFYAIVFNWRHYLELRLKTIYMIGQQLFDEEKPEIPPHHRLDRIWRDARRYVLRRWPEDDEADLAELDEHIHEISTIDPGSYVFRYTVEKDGSPAIPQHITHVGMREFRDLTMRVAQTLEGISLGLGVALDDYHDYLSEMRADTDY